MLAPMVEVPFRSRPVRVAAWFLAISYGVGSPLTAWIEFRSATISQRFDYSAEFIYLICAVQLVCVFGLFVRSLAPWAAAGFTVITLGALVSHLRIGSPLTAIPAVVYTAIQVWYGLKTRAKSANADPTP